MTHFPASIDELAELVRSFARGRRTIGVTGGAAPAGPAAVPVDEIVSTQRLAGIVEYEAADQIVTVHAGMTLAALQGVLREHDQRLAIDPPQPERTTVGGMVAANAYGALRTRFGTAKDVVVGVTIVRADGTRARGGGKVVKNVAGFDIPKLMIGTYGTLAAIASVTFRLHPQPRVSRRIVVDGCSAGRVRELVRAMRQAQSEPSAVTASFDGASYRFCATFEGFQGGVDAQCERFCALAGSGATWETEVGDGGDARAGALVAKIATSPSQIEALHTDAILPLYRCLQGARATVYPSVGAAFVAGDAGDTAPVTQALGAARAWAERAGGSLLVECAPPAVRESIDAWGSPPPSFALMRALKDRFDPERRFNPGGFVGGL